MFLDHSWYLPVFCVSSLLYRFTTLLYLARLRYESSLLFTELSGRILIALVEDSIDVVPGTTGIVAV